MGFIQILAPRGIVALSTFVIKVEYQGSRIIPIRTSERQRLGSQTFNMSTSPKPPGITSPISLTFRSVSVGRGRGSAIIVPDGTKLLKITVESVSNPIYNQLVNQFVNVKFKGPDKTVRLSQNNITIH